MVQSVLFSDLYDPKLWVSVVALLMSAWAAFNSWKSRRIAERALAIHEKQEQRRRPQLGIYMAYGYRRHLADKQLFGFFVSVSNPTDINNSISQAELQIKYGLENGIEAACRLPHTPALAEVTPNASAGSASVFSLPTRVDAHQTIAGLLVFSLDNKIIGGRTVDSHRILLEDSHGVVSETEPLLVKDWADETPKN